MRHIYGVFLGLVLLLLGACNSMSNQRNLVSVQLVDLKKGPVSDVQQTFYARVKLSNESKESFVFQKIAIDIELEGFRFFHAEQQQVLTLEQSETVSFEYKLRLEDSVRFFNELSARGVKQPSFLLHTSFQPMEWWQRSWSVEQVGQINLLN